MEYAQIFFALLIFVIPDDSLAFRCYKCNYAVDATSCYDPVKQNAPTTVCEPKSSNHLAFCYSIYLINHENRNKSGPVRGCKNDYEYGDFDDFCMKTQRENPYITDCEFKPEELFNKKIFNIAKGFSCYKCDSKREICHKPSKSSTELCLSDNPNHVSFCFTTYSVRKGVVRGCYKNSSMGGFDTVCDRIRKNDPDIRDCQYCTDEFCNNVEYNTATYLVCTNILVFLMGFLIIKLFN